MFSLHETTRTWCCRAAFVALCLLPTGVVAAWCVAVRLPSYRHAHERAIGEHLGWHAQLARASSPRPGLWLYEGLELSDPQSDQLLARVPFVEIETRGRSTTIKLPFPATINALRLDALLTSVERLARTAEDSRTLEFAAGSVTVHTGDGDQTLVDVTARIERSEDESTVSCSFHLAKADSAAASGAVTAPAALMIVGRHGAQDACTIEFSTGGTPLPCHLIAGSWPTARRLGKAAMFDGRITATRLSGRWKLDASGRVGPIELERLLATFPHKLTGAAELNLKHATIEDGRLESAAGTLAAGPGTISRSLIHAAQDSLQLEVSRRAFFGRSNRLAYQQLNIAFDIDPTGLALGGGLPQAAGALLIDEANILVRQPTVERQPVVNLLRTLVPQTAVLVPATRETSGLAAFLPVPHIVPPPGSEAPLPQARSIRLRPN